jgi:hypothetical protein
MTRRRLGAAADPAGGGVIDWLATAVMIASLVLGLIVLGTVALTKDFGPVQFLGAAAVELALVVQGVVAVVAVVGGHRPTETVTFLAYLFTVVLALPAGVSWAMVERTRSGIAVIALAYLVVAAMMLRMLTLWSTVG